MCLSTLILQNECRQLEHAAYWGRFKVLRIHTKSSRIEIHHCLSKRCLQPGEPSLYCKVYGWSYGLHFFGNYSTWNQGLKKSSQAPSCRYKCHHLPERLNLILCGFISFDFWLINTPEVFTKNSKDLGHFQGSGATPTLTNAHLLIHSEYTWFTAHDQFHSICTVDLTYPELVEHFV